MSFIAQALSDESVIAQSLSDDLPKKSRTFTASAEKFNS